MTTVNKHYGDMKGALAPWLLTTTKTKLKIM